MDIKSYLPVILTAAIAAAVMRPVQSQTLAERLNKINSERPTRHDVVMIQPEQTGASYDDGEGFSYHYQGYVIVNSSSSANAPHFPNYVVGRNVALTNLADGIAMLMDQGFERQPSVDGFLFIRNR